MIRTLSLPRPGLNIALRLGRFSWPLTWARARAAARQRPPADDRRHWTAAADALETAVLLFDNGVVSLVGGEEGLRACARAMGVSTQDPNDLIAALSNHEAGRAAIHALTELGEAADFDVEGSAGWVHAVGATSGGLAWLSLSPRVPSLAGQQVGGVALDAYPHPAWIVDRDGVTVMGNRAWLEALNAPNLSSALARGLTLDSGADELALSTLRSGERGARVRWLTLPQGRRAMRIWTEPLADGGAAVWTIDVTEARSATRSARLQGEALDLMLSQLQDAVAVFDQDRRLTRHNPAFAALWDLEPAWLAERPRHGEWLERLRQNRRLPPGEDYATFKSQELARHEQPEPSEAIWRLSEGRTLRVAHAPHPEGGLILVFSDITDELRVKTQFNHLLQVQQATLDKLTDAVAVFGADARLKLHNEAFQALWTLPGAVLAHGPHFDDLVEFCVGRLHDLQFWRDLKARIGDPDPHSRSAAAGEALTGDGRRLAWQSRPLPDGATLVGFTDVTDARRIENALSDRQAALDEAERLKHEFVAAVSRELRTPLTTILGYAELLDRDEEGLSGRPRARVGAIRSAATDLARSIDDILDIAELDAGEVRLQASTVEIGQLLTSALDRWESRAKAANLILRLAQPSAGGVIRADPGKLAKVLDHLIDNALRHTPSGGVVSLVAERGPGEISLTVSDTGPVIPYVVQARIFDRQASEDSGVARLGLALVKGLVELHGGWVTVESGPGAGAAFTCHLPEYGQSADIDPALA